MKIFISHAAVDKELVAALVDLLQTGLDISATQIFCMSLEGLGIPQGSNFVSFIRDKLKDARFVISVITQRYYESPFCLCELGGCWMCDKTEFFPILVPPLTYDDLKAILVGVQSGFIDDKRALNDLCDRLESANLSKKVATGRWESKRDEFLRTFLRIKKKLKGPAMVSCAKYEALEKTYESVQDTVEQKNAEIAQLKKMVERLKNCKDAVEVREIVKAHSTDDEEFERLTDEIQKVSHNVPRVALEALFYEYSGRHWSPTVGYGQDDDLLRRIEAAEEEHYLVTGNGVEARDHPKLNRIREKLDALASFLSTRPEAEMITSFEEDNDYPLSLRNRQFWTDHLELF